MNIFTQGDDKHLTYVRRYLDNGTIKRWVSSLNILEKEIINEDY
jgi:hypothetical protein